MRFMREKVRKREWRLDLMSSAKTQMMDLFFLQRFSKFFLSHTLGMSGTLSFWFVFLFLFLFWLFLFTFLFYIILVKNCSLNNNKLVQVIRDLNT